MKQTDIFEIMDMAKRAREIGEVFNPLFVGPPGVGKSQIVQQWAKANNYPVVDLRIAYLEAPDMIGYPSVENRNGRQVTVHNIPDMWPSVETAPKGVLLLEEVNRGTQSTMNTLMQLLTDRKIHKYTLPEGWLIASCINPENSANDVNTMDSALKDRFEIFHVDYDKKTFVAYMSEKQWDPSIIDFVQSNAWVFKKPEEIGNVDGNKYLSPRSWSKINAAINAKIPDEMEYEVFTELLGTNTGKAFFSFRRDEVPVTYDDLLAKEKASLKQLEKYADPENLKNAQLSVTIRSILENAANITDELLAKTCLVLPADQSLTLVSQIEYKLQVKPASVLDRLCKSNKKLLDYLKYTIKKDTK